MTLPDGCHPDCPACAHRGLSPQQSQQQKRQWLSQRLAPWAEQLAPLQFVGPEQQLGYRDRVSLSAEWRSGQWQFGVMRRDELIAIPDCPVHSERVRAVIKLLSEVLPGPDGFKLAFFSQSGAQTVLVLKQKEPPQSQWLSTAVGEKLAAIGVEGLWLHCYPSAGRHLFAKNGWQLLWGSPRSQCEQGHWYGPGAFTQLLPRLHTRSLDEAEKFLAPQHGDRVIDLYCGRGLSLSRWHAAGAECMGVELGAEALSCAALNVTGCELLRGACAQRVPQLQTWWEAVAPSRRLAYLNPPRTGLEAGVTEWLCRNGRPRRLAYLSCSAGTLARDLQQLEQGGYRVERLTPYDFFPGTYHVETQALLSYAGR